MTDHVTYTPDITPSETTSLFRSYVSLSFLMAATRYETPRGIGEPEVTWEPILH
jgi:hypothetical protein